MALAAIAGAHGVQGEVRLRLFADDLGAYRSLNGGALTLVGLRDGASGPIARFAEVRDRSAAEALRGTLLTVPREALPPLEAGEVYVADLIGLAVVSAAGTAIGVVVGVENYGAGDILEIEKGNGRRFMVPFNREAVPEMGERLVLADAYVE